MPKLSFYTNEIMSFQIIDRALKPDEVSRGRLAVGTDFFKEPILFDSTAEEIWVIRRKKVPCETLRASEILRVTRTPKDPPLDPPEDEN